MKKITGLLAALIICAGIVFVFALDTAQAAKQEGDIAGGVYDDVDWRITDEGKVTSMTDMFKSCSKLGSVKLSENFSFNENGLPSEAKIYWYIENDEGIAASEDSEG